MKKSRINAGEALVGMNRRGSQLSWFSHVSGSKKTRWMIDEVVYLDGNRPSETEHLGWRSMVDPACLDGVCTRLSGPGSDVRTAVDLEHAVLGLRQKLCRYSHQHARSARRYYSRYLVESRITSYLDLVNEALGRNSQARPLFLKLAYLKSHRPVCLFNLLRPFQPPIQFIDRSSHLQHPLGHPAIQSNPVQYLGSGKDCLLTTHLLDTLAWC